MTLALKGKENPLHHHAITLSLTQSAATSSLAVTYRLWGDAMKAMTY
jgi:hypothetical protein